VLCVSTCEEKSFTGQDKDKKTKREEVRENRHSDNVVIIPIFLLGGRFGTLGSYFIGRGTCFLERRKPKKIMRNSVGSIEETKGRTEGEILLLAREGSSAVLPESFAERRCFFWE